MALSEPKKTRDLSIEAVIYRLAVLRDREVDFASLQPRCRTEVWDGGYAVLMDEKPLAIVTLHSDTRFTVDVAENVVR